ncbi:hypothetical protein BGZ74_005457 [Mortierella antarctica]|nr:hypothetical protein BGZ74_005457 [Mortierella antarctica]
MIQALQAMASNHSNAINEERKLLQSELEQGLNQRKETLRLSAAQFQVRKMNGPPTITASINKTMDRWASVHQKLGHSRRVLVAELVTLFDLRHAPERRTRPAPLPETYDPLEQSILSTNTALTNNTQATNMTSSTRDATKKTTKLRVRDYLEDDSWNEYLIVGRPLPTGYFENYDTDEINTTIENVIHMMTLVACYLGIKLPFDTFTRSSKYYIQAAFTAGSKRAPLFLSESNIIAFAAGLGHLNYNIAFLCHSQGVHITLANATNTLENLLACCEAPNLGRYTNYASIVTKKPEDKSAGTHYSDMEDSMISPGSDDGDFETIDPYLRTRAPTSSKAQELNENVLWCPGQEPFDLNVHDLISVIRRRREEESPVWGGLHLQDAVAGNLNPLEDDYFMHEDQEEEDGMYTPTPENGGGGGGVRPGSSQSYHDGSTATSLSSLNRRPAHPRDRRQQTHQDRSYSTNGDAPGSKGHHGQPENWTFLDVDIFRAPSSVNRGAGGNGVLGGRGWPDISKLKQIGSAVGGAAVGLVNGAANVGRGSFSSGQSGLHRDETSTGGGSRRGSEMSPTSRAHLRGYPTFSSSAPS